MWMCIIYMILVRVYLSSGEYQCFILGNNISCTALEASSLYKNLSVTLMGGQSEKIRELQIENSYLPTINRNMLINFKNIEVLRLRNTSTRIIEEGAFNDLVNLTRVFVIDNYVEEFNSNVFPFNNTIHTLDLSHNLLHNLDSFNVNAFLHLTIMNISHNRLQYLPDNMLDKLIEENNFHLIVDNNPWNCLHPNWALRLSNILEQALCTDKTYDPSEIEIKIKKLSNSEYTTSASNGSEQISTFECMKYSLKGCLLWAIGAVWVGIILGNVCKLKRLLFTKSTRRFEDKNTQCDNIDLLRKV